jgi:hypothetical protein
MCRKNTLDHYVDGPTDTPVYYECTACPFRCDYKDFPRIDAALAAERRLAELQEAVSAASKIIKIMRREIPKTVGDMNIGLLMEDLAAVDALVGEE